MYDLAVQVGSHGHIANAYPHIAHVHPQHACARLPVANDNRRIARLPPRLWPLRLWPPQLKEDPLKEADFMKSIKGHPCGDMHAFAGFGDVRETEERYVRCSTPSAPRGVQSPRHPCVASACRWPCIRRRYIPREQLRAKYDGAEHGWNADDDDKKAV